MFILIPMFSDFILLLRVVAVYPPRQLPILQVFGVYTPIAVLKLARLVNSIVFARQWIISALDDANNVLQAGQAAWNGPFAKIEWFLMLFDTS